MDENMIAISGERNVMFVGRTSEYTRLKNELKRFNEENGKHVYLEFQGYEERVLFHEGDNSVYDTIKRVLINWFHCYEIEAELKALPFKNFKFE